MNQGSSWQPGIALPRLRQRAQLLQQARAFFAARNVLEVDTPIAVSSAVSDPHIHSLELAPAPGERARRFLHTSPEYAMKRLLAAGSGDIYQICHVFRAEESGPLHNSEFTLIEWYRGGFGMRQLIDEVAALAIGLLGRPRPVELLSYQQAFLRAVNCDPLTADDAGLAECALAQNLDAALVQRCSHDELLDLLMGARIGPTLGRDGLCFVYGYPASQASLARLDPADPRTALRFELYADGIELANGFEELGDAAEQRARFVADLQLRQRLGLPPHGADERLLAALEQGLPPCSGVALGFDRLMMLATGAGSIEEVLTFAADRA